jgi:hypothetical protein
MTIFWNVTLCSCPVYFCILKDIFFKLYIFYIFKLFWCIDIKNNFLKIKKIILIYFKIKNTLKNNHNHTPKLLVTPMFLVGLGFPNKVFLVFFTKKNCFLVQQLYCWSCYWYIYWKINFFIFDNIMKNKLR